MIKALARTPNGQLLLLGLSQANIERLQAGDPIHVDCKAESLSPPDAVGIFAGETEESMTAELLESGLLGPDTIVQTPDQAVDWGQLGGIVPQMEEELDRFLRENPDDGLAYIGKAAMTWAGTLAEAGISAHDPKALYAMFLGLRMHMDHVFQAEEQGSGPDHEDVLKIMHFIVHDGMMLAALKRGL